MKSIFLCSFILCSIATLTLAAKPAAEVDKVDNSKAHALIDKMVVATGGEEALKKIKTRVAEGELTMKAQGFKMQIKISQKAPNKVYAEQSMPGGMDVKRGYDGVKGWEENTLLGFRELSGPELEELKRQSDIKRELRLKEDYPTMKLLPSEEVNGKKAHVIEATAKDGAKETWYLDAETSLLIKSREKINLGPLGKVDATLFFKDYKEIDGIKLPMAVEVKNPAFEMTVKLNSVKHNVELDDKLFEAPEDEE